MKKDVLNKANLCDIVLHPIITEKATRSTELSKYTFAIHSSATKPDIKRAIEFLFDVKVSNVNILRRKGKKKIFKGRHGKRPDTKNAIVTLKDGSKIMELSGA